MPFDLAAVVDWVISRCWEPAAEAAILTLCAERYGSTEVVKALCKRKADWPKHAMIDEWDLRASRWGDLPDMSPRYPVAELAEGKETFVGQIMDFLGGEITGRDVLEVGCGTGRLTLRLVDVAAKVTSLDLSERMVKKNRARLGDRAREVAYLAPLFIQDYYGAHDVTISSQVLIHNVDDDAFECAIARIAGCAPVAFVFEDVTEHRLTSRATNLRPKQVLIDAFKRHGMLVERQGEQMLFDDRIAFLKFTRG